MANPKLTNPEQRAVLQRQRALKKQARRTLKRRETIMAGLNDRLLAAMLEHDEVNLFRGEDDDHPYVPMALLPARQLRRRVAELNLETGSFHLAPPSPGDCSRPDPVPVADAAARDTDDEPASKEESNTAHEGDPITAKTVAIVPARHPRRRGRNVPTSPASSALHPYMPDQERTLRTILDLCTGGGPVTPGVGRRHPCPGCLSRLDAHEVGAPGVDPRPLTVYPTAAGDLVFRCHRCGFCLDSVEFLHHAGRGRFPTLAEAARCMTDGRMLAAALPAAQLAGYERLAILRSLLEQGRARYKQRLGAGNSPRLFGDWALLSVRQLAGLFPDRRFPGTLPAECLGRLGRDGFGRLTVLDLHAVRCFTRFYRLELRDWEQQTSMGVPLVLFTARWADYLGWRQLIVCDRYPLARDLELALARWPDAERLPLAMLEDGEVTRAGPGAVATALDTSLGEVWLALRGHAGCATAGLAFCGVGPGATVVRVRRLPPVPGCRVEGEHLVLDEDRLQEHPLLASRAAFCHPASAPECVADVAATLAQEKDHQPLALALADVLNHLPGVHPTVRRRLVEEVAARAGMGVDDLMDGMDMNVLAVWPGGPYALHAPGGTSYVARAGCYWRRGSREKAWSPVSNFCLRLVGDKIDAKGRVTHHGRLDVGDKRMWVTLSTAVLESAQRLRTTLTGAATRSGADYPVICDPKARRLLPELVKATWMPRVGCKTPCGRRPRRAR